MVDILDHGSSDAVLRCQYCQQLVSSNYVVMKLVEDGSFLNGQV